MSERLYRDTPKAVFAAMAVSFANQCNDAGVDAVWDEGEAGIDALLIAEWTALYDAGIVPQKPPNTGWFRVRKARSTP